MVWRPFHGVHPFGEHVRPADFPKETNVSKSINQWPVLIPMYSAESDLLMITFAKWTSFLLGLGFARISALISENEHMHL